ncbi:MAG TPA: cellulase family glycosylhydrolase, partial [Ktedonobacterales bacterium]|nr:cellulase family glycosylhydrolase [Ktedonobacterales bacterium]
MRRLAAAMRVRPITYALRALAVVLICATSLHAMRAALPPPTTADARPATTAVATRVPASIATTAPTVTVPPSHTPGVAVAGTRIVDTRTGQAITLVGASRSGLEYSCTGDGHFQPADFAAMRAWGMNVVRLTLSSELWANHAGACPGYRALVRVAVANAEAQGLYVILALQWTAPFDTSLDRAHGGAQCPMPDGKQDVSFWRDLAALYHGDQRVIFDLMGEPYGVSFAVWENGGPITAGCDVIGGGVAHESGVYQAIGMRDLVTVVRDGAPENVLILSGTN